MAKQASPRSRPGGRTARTTEAVYEAAIAELGDRAYDEVGMDSIAARAGVHKTTVYRRWGTKDRVLAEALDRAAEQRVTVPDTGDVGRDLRALALAVQKVLTSRDGAATARALAAAAPRSAEIRGVIQRFWATRMTHVGPIVERAVTRGQLPAGTDADALLKHLSAPLYQRLLVTLEPVNRRAAERAAAATLAAAQAGVFVG
jgi:AcrR family transcriptional regulator